MLPIDVVIPVYNAPELTRRCIESLYASIGGALGEVRVHDNASDAATRAMLDGLRYPRLVVHHAPCNTGFGDGVNRAVAATRSDLVLVLNSDVAASSDFLAPLRHALASDPTLAAVTPAGNTFASYDLRRYARRSGCVVTHNLYAYAFLIRRAAFERVGGFDPVFGLGFFEDTDLSRKLTRAGYWLGIHPESQLHHEIHGSFDAVPAFRELLGKNRGIYLERYPAAARHALVVSGAVPLEHLPRGAGDALSELLRDGGRAQWMTRAALDGLPSLEVRASRLGVTTLLRTLRHHDSRERRRFTEVWLTADVPRRHAAWLRRFARSHKLPVRAVPAS
jgi:GT2 family glycosyltransferase